MVSFKGAHFVKDIILTCVRWYAVYPLSYRQVEELMQERGGIGGPRDDQPLGAQVRPTARRGVPSPQAASLDRLAYKRRHLIAGTSAEHKNVCGVLNAPLFSPI